MAGANPNGGGGGWGLYGEYTRMGRRELQELCKKHGIRANLPNAAMAKALYQLSQGMSTPKELLKSADKRQGRQGTPTGTATSRRANAGATRRPLLPDLLEEDPDQDKAAPSPPPAAAAAPEGASSSPIEAAAAAAAAAAFAPAAAPVGASGTPDDTAAVHTGACNSDSDPPSSEPTAADATTADAAGAAAAPAASAAEAATAPAGREVVAEAGGNDAAVAVATVEASHGTSGGFAGAEDAAAAAADAFAASAAVAEVAGPEMNHGAAMDVDWNGDVEGGESADAQLCEMGLDSEMAAPNGADKADTMRLDIGRPDVGEAASEDAGATVQEGEGLVQLEEQVKVVVLAVQAPLQQQQGDAVEVEVAAGEAATAARSTATAVDLAEGTAAPVLESEVHTAGAKAAAEGENVEGSGCVATGLGECDEIADARGGHSPAIQCDEVEVDAVRAQVLAATGGPALSLLSGAVVTGADAGLGEEAVGAAGAVTLEALAAANMVCEQLVPRGREMEKSEGEVDKVEEAIAEEVLQHEGLREEGMVQQEEEEMVGGGEDVQEGDGDLPGSDLANGPVPSPEQKMVAEDAGKLADEPMHEEVPEAEERQVESSAGSALLRWKQKKQKAATSASAAALRYRMSRERVMREWLWKPCKSPATPGLDLRDEEMEEDEVEEEAEEDGADEEREEKEKAGQQKPDGSELRTLVEEQQVKQSCLQQQQEKQQQQWTEAGDSQLKRVLAPLLNGAENAVSRSPGMSGNGKKGSSTIGAHPLSPLSPNITRKPSVAVVASAAAHTATAADAACCSVVVSVSPKKGPVSSALRKEEERRRKKQQRPRKYSKSLAIAAPAREKLKAKTQKQVVEGRRERDAKLKQLRTGGSGLLWGLVQRT